MKNILSIIALAVWLIVLQVRINQLEAHEGEILKVLEIDKNTIDKLIDGMQNNTDSIRVLSGRQYAR